MRWGLPIQHICHSVEFELSSLPLSMSQTRKKSMTIVEQAKFVIFKPSYLKSQKRYFDGKKYPSLKVLALRQMPGS